MLDLKNEFSEVRGFHAVVKTPFPVTYLYYTDTHGVQGAFVNRKMLQAHNLITEHGKSPYIAWMETLGRKYEELPSLLNLDADACDKLMDHPDRSPPPANVHHFCDQLGINPACLLPLKRDAGLFHYPVLRAVAHIYKDKTIPEQDRRIAGIYLENERTRFKEFSSTEPVIASYILTAMQNARKLRPSYDGKSVYKSNNPASDVEMGMDILHAELKKQLKKHTAEKQKNHGIIKRSKFHLDAVLGSSACSMYGAGRYVDAVDKVVERMALEEKKDCTINWKLFPDGYWRGKGDSVQVEFTTIDLHPDLELNARRQGCHPADLVTHFERSIFMKVASILHLEQNERSVDRYKQNLNRFNAWRESGLANSHHIPLLANYILADRALGRENLRPDPLPEYDGKQRNKYEYEYTVK